MRRLAWIGIALVAVSCDPRKFNDVADSSWIAIAERDSTQTGGDFGYDVMALPLTSGETGIRFIVAAGGSAGSTGSSLPGLAQITYDEHGSKTQQIGGNGEKGGKGLLEPLDDTGSPTALLPLDGGQFLVGVLDAKSIIRYDTDFKNGTKLYSGLPNKSPAGIAMGDLGVGTSAPDLVVIGELTLSVLPDSDPGKTAITCNLKPPNASQTVAVNKQALAVARLSGNHDQIIVAARPLDDADHGSCSTDADCSGTAGAYCDFNVCHMKAQILILDASAIQNGQPCPRTGIDVPYPGPTAIAVGNLDSDPRLDIVAGTIHPTGNEDQQVRVYFNVTGPGNITPQMVGLTADEKDEASNARGTRLAIADVVPGGAAASPNELIVADPGANVNGVSASGDVRIYTLGACSDTAAQRGAACLVTDLYDPSPSKNEYFGRGIATGQFKTSKGTTTVLAVSLKDRLWTYFRLTPDMTDPRVK